MWPFNNKKTTERSEKDPRANYAFDDEDRQHAVLMRGMNRDMRRMEMEMQRLRMKRDLQDLKDEIYGDDEDSGEEGGGIEDHLMSQLLGTVMQGKQQQQAITQMPTPQPPTRPELTDDEIRAILDTVDKKMLKTAKVAPKAMVKAQLAQKATFTEAEFERGYKILLEEY